MDKFEKFKILNQPMVMPVISKGTNFNLENDVSYNWGKNGEFTIIIKSGYIFDGASVPRILHWFIGPMDPRVVASSLIHDAIYTNPDLKGVGIYLVNGKITDKTFTKAEADRIFQVTNKANNMDRVRTMLAYWAVRLFGRGSF